MGIPKLWETISSWTSNTSLEVRLEGEIGEGADDSIDTTAAMDGSDTARYADSFSDHICDLIRNGKHQIVLTGAPGTGKTYTAKQIAYTFIRGRAVREEGEEQDSDEDVAEFNPLYAFFGDLDSMPEDEQKKLDHDRFKRVITRLMRDLAWYPDDKAFREQYTGGEKGFSPEQIALIPQMINSSGNYEATDYDAETLWSDADKLRGRLAFVQFHPSYDYTDFVEGLRPVESKTGDMIFRRMDGSFMRFCRYVAWRNNTALAKSRKRLPKYFFIIDEINRADLAKVLGELMFGLESDKRGDRIETQYHNLTAYFEGADEKARSKEFFFNCFNDGFYIPRNIVVIGTMNDIDRSVESMDFAMRRRFVWEEVKVTPELLKEAFRNGRFFNDLLDEGSRTKENVETICDLIAGGVYAFNNSELFRKKANFGSDYDIAQGHFSGLRSRDLSGLEPKCDLSDPKSVAQAVMRWVWIYRVAPLLKEYLRAKHGFSVESLLPEWAPKPCPVKVPGKRQDASAIQTSVIPEAGDGES